MPASPEGLQGDPVIASVTIIGFVILLIFISKGSIGAENEKNRCSPDCICCD